MFFCKDQDQSVSLDAFQERLRQTQQVHADNADTLNAALRLIADIREAAGDPADSEAKAKGLQYRLAALCESVWGDLGKAA
jgi:hypothetical protein